MASARLSWTSMRRNSWAIRSAATLMTSPAIALRAARVAGSISKLEPRRQPDGSEHAKLVLAQPRQRIADGAQHAILEIRVAPDVVDQLVGERIEEHAVDREIAAGGIELGGAEDDRLGTASVEISTVATKRRHLDLNASVSRLRGPAPRRTRCRP